MTQKNSVNGSLGGLLNGNHSPEEEDADIQYVSGLLDEWRSERPEGTRGQIPPWLWYEAAKVCNGRFVSKVANALNLNVSKLRMFVEKLHNRGVVIEPRIKTGSVEEQIEALIPASHNGEKPQNATEKPEKTPDKPPELSQENKIQPYQATVVDPRELWRYMPEPAPPPKDESIDIKIENPDGSTMHISSMTPNSQIFETIRFWVDAHRSNEG